MSDVLFLNCKHGHIFRLPILFKMPLGWNVFFKSQFVSSRSFFRGKICFFFEKNNFIIIFGLWAKNYKLSKFWPKIFGRVVKTVFYEFRGTLWGKSFFLKKTMFIIIFGLWVKNYRTFGKNFWQSCQNCILRVQTNVLGSPQIFHKRERNWPKSFNMNAFGKHRVKKNSPFEWMIFLPFFKYGWKMIISMLHLHTRHWYAKTKVKISIY